LTQGYLHCANLELNFDFNSLAFATGGWFFCGGLGVLIKACRRPRRMFRGGGPAVPVVIAGVMLGAIALYSALTNLDEDF